MFLSSLRIWSADILSVVIRLFALLLLAAAGAAGISVTELQPRGRVNDFAGVVDPFIRKDLERYLAHLEKTAGVQMAIVTLRTIEGQPLESFANDLYRHCGIGKKGKDEGALLLLVVDDKLSRLETGRGLEPVITDGTAGSLLREMRPALKDGKYGEALGTAVESLGRRIAQAKGVSIESAPPPVQRVPEEQKPSAFPWALLLFVIFLAFMLPRRRRQRRYHGGGGGFLPGLVLGGLNRPVYGGHSHGGFGGYDSSDSFGGFGGGDSGGGGASSSW